MYCFNVNSSTYPLSSRYIAMELKNKEVLRFIMSEFDHKLLNAFFNIYINKFFYDIYTTFYFLILIKGHIFLHT